jgi:hypothetical protein
MVLLAALVACTGDVAIYLADDSVPRPGGELELSAIIVPVRTVEVTTDSGDVIELKGGPNPYNLLDFSGASTTLDLLTLRDTPVLVSIDELPIERLVQARLLLEDAEPPLVTTVDGAQTTLVIPEDVDERLTVACDLRIRSGHDLEATLDLDAHASVTHADDGTWILTPVLSLAGE